MNVYANYYDTHRGSSLYRFKKEDLNHRLSLYYLLLYFAVALALRVLFYWYNAFTPIY